jgi:predicted nucleic acid-binding protein
VRAVVDVNLLISAVLSAKGFPAEIPILTPAQFSTKLRAIR